ncbi:MAG: type II secretion system protein [Candidatus Omnitrophica bacterium]|nr:type II secretion system protein [Candidatus Omnitrophota bacterium]
MRQNKRAGFMLLEVIMSMIIISFGLLFVMRSYATSIRISTVARGLSRACLLLEDKLFDFDLDGFREGIKETEEEGAVVEEPDYKWRAGSQPVGEEREKELTRLDISMAWKKRVVAVSTILKYRER